MGKKDKEHVKIVHLPGYGNVTAEVAEELKSQMAQAQLEAAAKERAERNKEGSE